MKERLTMFLTLFLLSIGVSLAQNKITGTVLEENGEPCIGATVAIQGEKAGVGVTVTDFDGKFSLAVPAGKKLVISYIGMETQTVTPKNGMKVYLKNSAALQEIVVTGMTKMDRRMFTGATDQIKADEAMINGMADISRSLEGRSAGVSVQNVSGTFGTWCYVHLWLVEAPVGG